MTSFDKREEGFERKFVHEEEIQFKAAARRDKLLGLWAAEKMGMSDDEAADYAKSLIKEDLTEPGDDDVFRKLRADFDQHEVDQSDHQIRRTMDEYLQEAITQVKSEG